MAWLNKRQQLTTLYGLAYVIIGLELFIAPGEIATSTSYVYLFFFMSPEVWGAAFAFVGLLGITVAYTARGDRVLQGHTPGRITEQLVAVATGGMTFLATSWAFGMFIALLNDQLRNGPGLVMWIAFAIGMAIYATPEKTTHP